VGSLLVEYVVANDVSRVRFPVRAFYINNNFSNLYNLNNSSLSKRNEKTPYKEILQNF
jgi:hypothetical protein